LEFLVQAMWRKALAEGFIKHGHQTMIGTRDPAKLAEWKRQSQSAGGQLQRNGGIRRSAGAGGEGLDRGRCIAPGGKRQPGRQAGDGRVQPIADAPPVNGVLKFFTTLDDSLMERLQREFPKAHFVKAFNSVGHGQFVNPQYKAGKPTMFICGNDDGAKAVTAQILEQFGWETADMGKVESARAIEPLCMLWCVLGFTKNEWTHAFKLLHQ
jgi:8-hydroxy-5-deazaflavin:NADPH oxidoreductase